jgi:hypothetical protein
VAAVSQMLKDNAAPYFSLRIIVDQHPQADGVKWMQQLLEAKAI